MGRGSLSQSLFIPLIAPYNCICTLAIGKKAGAQGISIAVIIHSFDRTLHIVFSRLILAYKGWCARRAAYGVCLLLFFVGERDGFEEVHGGAHPDLLVVAVEQVFQDIDGFFVDSCERHHVGTEMGGSAFA